MPALTAIALGASALGGIASAFGKTSPTFNMGPMGSGEAQANMNAGSDLQQFQGAESQYASMASGYAQNGDMPTAQDITNGQSYAASQFGQQRAQMNQAFVTQQQQANQDAALQGRGTDDPILRAKLAIAQTNQSAQLNAAQGAFASQFSMQQPMQRLGFAGQAMSAAQGAFNTNQSYAQQQYGNRFGEAQANYQQQKDTVSPLQRIGSALGVFGSSASSLLGLGGQIGASQNGNASPSFGNTGSPMAASAFSQPNPYAGAPMTSTFGPTPSGSAYGLGATFGPLASGYRGATAPASNFSSQMQSLGPSPYPGF